MTALDILTDDNGNLLLQNGDVVVGDSTAQQVRDLLLTRKGDMKWEPGVGVGLEMYLLGDNPDFVRRLARQELSRDGFAIRSLVIDEGQIVIDGNYQ